MLLPVGKLLFQTAPKLGRYTSYHGTQLCKFKISDPFYVKKIISVETPDICGWLPNQAMRKAANWARHQPDSILVEFQSDHPPLKDPLGIGSFFPEGTALKITRVWELSHEWKTRGAKKG